MAMNLMGPCCFRTLGMWCGILVLLSMPAGLSLAEDNQTASEPEEELVWPSPPQQPRIRYITSFTNSDDVAAEKGFFGKLWEFIIGPDELISLVKPMGVAADSQGRVIVADAAGKRIHIFDQTKRAYSVIDQVDERSLELPIEALVDDQDNIYVADAGLKKVFVFDKTGAYTRSLGGESLQRPTGIAIDNKRKWIYVVDTPAHEVKVFSLDDGGLIKTIGERGNVDGTFNFPSYVTTDQAGSLYVTDGMNKRIRVFGQDASYQRAIGSPGDGSGNFSAPKGVAVDSEGHIYVADVAFDNVQIFDQEGRLLMAFGASGQAPGKFWMPTGLFIDRNDRIYVADSYNNRIQVFQYLKSGDDMAKQ